MKKVALIILFFVFFETFSQNKQICKIEFEYILSHSIYENLYITFKVNHNKQKVKVKVKNERNNYIDSFKIFYDDFVEVLKEIENIEKDTINSFNSDYICLDAETSLIKVFYKNKSLNKYHSYYCLKNTEKNEERILGLSLCKLLIRSAKVDENEFY